MHCPHCDKNIPDKVIKSYAARLAGLKNRGKSRAPGAGRPRTIEHNSDSPSCRCVDCRRARGYLGPKKSA